MAEVLVTVRALSGEAFLGPKLIAAPVDVEALQEEVEEACTDGSGVPCNVTLISEAGTKVTVRNGHAVFVPGTSVELQAVRTASQAAHQNPADHHRRFADPSGFTHWDYRYGRHLTCRERLTMRICLALDTLDELLFELQWQLCWLSVEEILHCHGLHLLAALWHEFHFGWRGLALRPLPDFDEEKRVKLLHKEQYREAYHRRKAEKALIKKQGRSLPRSRRGPGGVQHAPQRSQRRR